MELDEILDLITIEDDGACGDPECCGAPSYSICEESKKKAKAAIITLFKSMVPEEQKYEADWGGMDLNDQKDEAAVYGFNKCRDAILSKIEELK